MKKLKHSGPFMPLAPRAEETRSVVELKAAVFDELQAIERAHVQIIEPAKQRIQQLNQALNRKLMPPTV